MAAWTLAMVRPWMSRGSFSNGQAGRAELGQSLGPAAQRAVIAAFAHLSCDRGILRCIDKGHGFSF